MGPIIIGVKLGQRAEPTAIAVAEQGGREEGGQAVDTYVIRFMTRLPAGTSYPAVSQRIAEVGHGLQGLADAEGTQLVIALYVDVTALGDPVVALIRESGYDPIPVYATHGDKRVELGNGSVSLGKAWLVSRLQALLQTGRLALPRTPEAETLAGDLITFQIDSAQVDNQRDGAFSVGPRDDLVTALGLVTQGFPEVETYEVVFLEDVIGPYRVHIGGDEADAYLTPYERQLRQLRNAWGGD